MKKTNSLKVISVTLLLLFVTVTSILMPALANPPGPGAGKKQIKVCTVTSGDVVTQVGNTCDAGGNGCSSNPCGD